MLDEDSPDGGLIADIRSLETVALAFGEIAPIHQYVEIHDLVTRSPEKIVDDRGTDEAGTAGNQIFHTRWEPSNSIRSEQTTGQQPYLATVSHIILILTRLGARAFSRIIYLCSSSSLHEVSCRPASCTSGADKVTSP
jgi:hypothetical protein